MNRDTRPEEQPGEREHQGLGMPATERPKERREPLIRSDDILVVRRGPGANCSSIGSALDVLFLSAVAAGAVLAGVAAAFGEHRDRDPKGDRGQGPPPPPTPENGGQDAGAAHVGSEEESNASSA